ncbi:MULTISPECIES: flagellar motor protein [unclassified Colwellia]|uniref:flagellar motor protein n=1 Tax=unclassified Colwellia TaxID=196834 RepID=UPI0015F6BCE0|nr:MULTISPECIES: flagellar motor protein [unclassified Colwellia]MBA6223160.1 flagellar motor protein [Colwellia sp. MB3u-45]MBA6267584.1 flagellar motor protein [Colwellia sp. MB3u-43]MBA6289886.1 flagellar motor protein [Colwellia sp. MB3u-4]MBA6295571.1 flagellar motor protein [Colwellia sp. MB02u-9]MBA6320289.1 flagellar motor protein [Colwellia sp. MB02u-19]
MDKLSIAGLLIAIFAIYFGFIIDGGAISSLLELPAFIIVFGGTLGAVMLQSSQSQFFHAISLLKWLFVPPKYDIEQGIESIVLWAEKARESGFLSLEYIAKEENDFYVNKGLNLLVDGVEVENLRVSLELDLDLYREHNLRSAHVFESMGGYSPTIGIIGAVLGLIHAMSNLADPQLLGQGIATAFVATIYGVGFANLLYLPVANKIKAIVHEQTMYREMMTEGLIAIALAENPHAIENKLSAFRLEQ